jgi:N-terminal half of MaoC dehydratase
MAVSETIAEAGGPVTLNRALVGKTYAAVELRLDPGQVAAFSRAVGHPSDGVPPTIATAPELRAGLANVLVDPELGADLARVLHGEQRYTWHRPFVAGETVVAVCTIEDIRGRPTLEFLTLRTEIRDSASTLICEARSTLLHRGDA